MLLRDKVWLLHVLAFVVLMLCDAGIAACAEDNDAAVERFKVVKDGDALLVPVILREKINLFLIDTGFTASAFDRSLLKGEPKPIREVNLITPSDKIRMPIFDVPVAFLGGQDLERALPFVVGIDLTRIREKSGHGIHGILGMDFLREWAVQVDFDQGELLLKRDFPQPQSLKSFDMPFNETGRPQIQCLVSGWGETSFEIDTGSMSLNSGSIESRLFQYLVRLGHMRVVGKSKSSTVAGVREVQLGQLKSFSLGPYQHENLIFSEGKSNRLSLNYLSRYNVTFDFPNERLYLSNSKAFNKRDLRNLSGLQLVRRDGATIVESVEPEGAAEKAGIRAGDQIVKVGDADVSRNRMREVMRFFSQENPSLTVTVIRDGKPFEHSIELK